MFSIQIGNDFGLWGFLEGYGLEMQVCAIGP